MNKTFSFSVNPLKGNILKGMIRFSIPLMLVSILQMLFTATDTAIIGNFGSAGAMASIGVCGSAISLITALALGLSTGVSVIIGEAYGKENTEKVTQIINTIPLTGMALGTILAIFAIILSRPILTGIDVSETLIDNALLYFRIYFLGVPFVVAFNFMSGALQAKGDSVHPLLFQLAGGVLNLVLNLVFVIGFNLDVAGVAIATVISQLVNMLLIMNFLTKQNDEMHLELKKLTVFKYMNDICRIGVPSSISWCIMDVSNVLIQKAINSFPDIAIEGITAASQIEGFLYISFVGFSSACIVYISQNYGAGNFDRINQTFWYTLLGCVVVGEAMGIPCALFGKNLLHLFTKNAEAYPYGLIKLQYMGFPFALCGTMNSLNGCIKGLQYPKIAMTISLLTAGLFRVSYIMIINNLYHDLKLIYLAYPLTWGLSTLLCIIFFVILLNKRKKEKLISD